LGAGQATENNMRKFKFIGFALLAVAMCACSGNKTKGQADANPVQTTATQDSAKADTIAKMDTAVKDTAKLDPKEMKSVVRKFFASYWEGNVNPLLSKAYRKLVSANVNGTPDIGFGGDMGYEDGSLKIISADPESGIVKAKARGSYPDEEAEDGEVHFTADYKITIIKENGKYVIDKIKHSGFDF